MDYPIKTLSQLRPILKGFRKSAGMTQTMMASHLGVTQQTYAQLEANPASASVERLFKVLRVLDVHLTLSQAAYLAGKVEGAERVASTVSPDKGTAVKIGPAAKAPHAKRSSRRTVETEATGRYVEPGLTTAAASKRPAKAGTSAGIDKPRIARKNSAGIKKREVW
jgi:HTH-type transcriptional regulator/antitoxin HipB